MNEAVTIMMDNDPVRFTEDGKISVVDAIKAITASERPHEIWEKLKIDNPDLLDFCESHPSGGGRNTAFINQEGWERIWILMADYLFYSG